MKIFKSLLLCATLFLFSACSSTTDTNPISGGNNAGGVQAKVTCVKGIPDGSKAVVRGTTDTIHLVNGCFETANNGIVAGRASAIENDTILVFNDTSLFALTIPFNMLGDTVQMVSTNLNLLNAKTGQFDSILAVVYDKAHIHERFVKMKKAYTSTKVQFHVSMYSPVNGSDYQIHYEFHKGDSVWTSELITAERGAEFSNDVSEMDSGSVPKIDTSDLFTIHGINTPHKVNVTSIYGISKIFVDGVETKNIVDTVWGKNIHTIKVIDSAGYSANAKIHSYVGYDFANDTGLSNIHNIYNSTYRIGIKIDTVSQISSASDTNSIVITYSFNGNLLHPSYFGNGHYIFDIGHKVGDSLEVTIPAQFKNTFIY